MRHNPPLLTFRSMHIQADSLAEGSIYPAGHLIHGCGHESHSHITKAISDITGFWDASKDPFKFLMREVIDDVWKQSYTYSTLCPLCSSIRLSHCAIT